MNGSRVTDSAVDLRNDEGAGAFLVICEHASNFIPAEYRGLGLNGAALVSHAAWDPGALAVAGEMASLLDSPLVAQRFSRLLYDCNRPPDEPSAVPETSEVYAIPGNTGLSAQARRERAERFYLPFRSALGAAIDARMARFGPPVIVTIHSFTPVYNGVHREVEIGILHDKDARLADALLTLTNEKPGFVIRRNDPYGPSDGVTHTLREHALPRGLLNVMIEIRNDLIASRDRQEAMARRLSAWLAGALLALGLSPLPRPAHADANAQGGLKGQ